MAFFAGGKLNVYNNISAIAEYNQLLSKNNLKEAKPSLEGGIEIGTATHSFQIFVTNYNSIVNQRSMVYNINDLSKGEFLIGFNIIAIL
ncbi:MAG: hypothetical protein HC896_04535 [Bacteroidales bacterium]|nr:hypothetical protein [Bacteroidales bacterium]